MLIASSLRFGSSLTAILSFVTSRDRTPPSVLESAWTTASPRPHPSLVQDTSTSPWGTSESDLAGVLPSFLSTMIVNIELLASLAIRLTLLYLFANRKVVGLSNPCSTTVSFHTLSHALRLSSSG